MAIRKLSVSSNGGISVIDNPVKQYYLILADDQIPNGKYDRPADNSLGFPMVFRLETHSTIKMTKEIQEYIFSFNRSDNERRDRMAFQGYCDTWATNYGKVRDCANFITGENIFLPLPKWTNLVCGGNVICGEEMISDGSYGIRSGVRVLKVETIDSNNLISGLSYENSPHLIHHMTIIRPNTINGRLAVNPFPQMGGKSNEPYRPSYYPLMSPKPVYIEMVHLKKLELGSGIPNPYNPEWK